MFEDYQCKRRGGTTVMRTSYFQSGSVDIRASIELKYIMSYGRHVLCSFRKLILWTVFCGLKVVG
jgi:hypothetical protein